MPPKKDVNTTPPVVIIRKKGTKGTTPSALPKPILQRSAPGPKVVSPPTPPVQPVAQPIPPPTYSQPAVPQPPPATAAVTDTGPSKKEKEKKAQRELLEVLRERWPLAFPQDYRQIRPLAIGIKRDIVVHLPQYSLLRISAAIGLFQRLMGPAYYHVVLRGGPRYDLDGNPRGEVTPEEQEHAKRDLAAYQARRKQWLAAKQKVAESSVG